MKDFLTSVQEEFLLLNSRWKKREKTRLYRALARFGRHGIHQIAQRVRTKNIVQIQRYLHLLETLAQYAPPIQVKIPEASEVSSLQEESENVKAERQTHREELKFLRIQPVSHDQTTLFRSHRTLTSHHRTTAALCRALAVWLRPIISTLIALAKERKKNTRESFQQRPVVTIRHCDVQTALWLTSNTVHNTDERPEIFLSHNTQNSFTDNELTDQPLPEN